MVFKENKKIVKDYSIKNQAYLDTYYLHGNKMKSWKSLTITIVVL